MRFKYLNASGYYCLRDAGFRVNALLVVSLYTINPNFGF